MKTKPFTPFYVAPAANGIVVETRREPHMATGAEDTHVFNDFTDFIEWLAKETMQPYDQVSADPDEEQI